MKVGDLQWFGIPPGQSVARPEAIRAAQERTACVNKVVNAVTLSTNHRFATVDSAPPHQRSSELATRRNSVDIMTLQD